MGYEGFSGNESILYHLQSPCRLDAVGEFTPIEREEWVPDAHVHRLADANGVEPGGDPVRGRRLLMWNGDVEVSVCKPTRSSTASTATARATRCIFVHRGCGVLRTVFGRVPFREHDYVVIPRGTTHRSSCRRRGAVLARASTRPGEIETPNRYRNRYGQLLEHAPFSQRDFHPPAELETHDESGEYELIVRVRDGHQDYVLDHHPFDVVGWDGYVYPYTFNADDFEPRTGRFHLPPPAHQTFQGPNFVICTFARGCSTGTRRRCRSRTTTRTSSPRRSCTTPPATSPRARAWTSGFITLHPSGLPHGPQPGAVEKALGKSRPTSWR